MIRERSQTNRTRAGRDLGRAELALSDELVPLPDWSQLGRHILAEAMRRALARMETRLAQGAVNSDSQAKERA